LSARTRDTEDYQNLAAQSPPFVGIDEARRQQRRTPARDFAGLAALPMGKGKGDGGGGPEPFIGAGGGRITHGIKRNEEGE
jgi:hypothetical protein